MYATVKHSGGRARIVGVGMASLLTLGAGWVFTYGMIRDYIAPDRDTTTLIMIPPEKLQEVKPVEEKKEIKIEKVVEAPPLIVPDVPVVVDVPPPPPSPARC